MEDSLRVDLKDVVTFKSNSLNPCFNGRFSQSKDRTELVLQIVKVLILVLMEDSLRGPKLILTS